MSRPDPSVRPLPLRTAKGLLRQPFFLGLRGVGRRIMVCKTNAPKTMANASLLQAFVEAELGRSADLIARTLAVIQAQLRLPGDTLLNASERQHHFDLAQALAQHQVTYQRRFVDALRNVVVADMAPSADDAGPTSAHASGLGGLQLMDENRVESEIGLSRAIQEIDTIAEWELRELQTFTSTLRGQEHTTAESNPLRPRAYAQALAEAAESLPIAPVQQSLLLRVSATAMAPLLKSAWAAATSRLERQGVTPSIYRTVVFAAGAGTRAPAVNITQPGALDALRRTMPEGQSTGAAPGDLDSALSRIEALLSRMPSAAGVAAAPGLLEHRASLLATTGGSMERQVIELIARLFEIIVSDPGLHPTLRSQLGRLQVSALRIALHDPEMLDRHEHPVWVFMARLANAASSYPNVSDARLVALLSFSGHLIDDLTVQGQQGAAQYKRGLAALDTFLDGQLHEQQGAARKSIETLLRAEQADQLQQQLSARLADQLAPVRTTPAIRRFITGAWAKVLATAMLEHGDTSEVATSYMKTLDDLVWSLQPPDHPQSRQRLLAMLPGMLQRLRAGAASIDLPQAERQAVLDDLVVVHTAALKPGGRPPAAPERALTPEEIVRQLREETALPPVDPVPFSDSLIDLGSMDTVPAALMTDTTAAETEDASDWVDRLAPGVRQRIFLNGRWTQAQLLWRSPRGSYFVYAGEAPDRTHSVTRRALERLRKAELLDTVEGHSLIQRAVDALIRRLDNPPRP